MLIVLCPLFAFLAGCAAIGTAVSHGSLETQTLMSKSVFLDPVPNKDKVVYLQVRNTTDKPEFKITDQLRSALEDKGYRVTSNFSRAYYIVQVNILKVGKSSETAAKEMMGSGYGGALEGAVAGGVITAEAGGDPVVGGLVGGVAGTIVDNLVKDVNYTGVIDLKITAKAKPRKQVYTTRIISKADRVNLSFDAAMPKLEKGLVDSISGMF